MCIRDRYLASAGLIPTEWTTSQLQYMTYDTSKITLNGNQWTHSLIYWLIQQSYQIWQHRNNKLHGCKNTDDTNNQLHHHVRDLYSQKMQLLPIDQKMFHLPLEQRLQQTISTLKQWFQQTYKTTQRCLQQTTSLLQQGQTDIQTYFTELQQAKTKD